MPMAAFARDTELSMPRDESRGDRNGVGLDAHPVAHRSFVGKL